MLSESLARAILQIAINEQRCAELLGCLFEGGSATVDMTTKKLILIPASIIEEAMETMK